MCPSYPRHRRSLGQSFLDNPQLLFQRSVPLSCGRLSVSVHHCSTWTLSLAVHVASMTSNYTIVQTARAGRLPIVGTTRSLETACIEPATRHRAQTVRTRGMVIVRVLNGKIANWREYERQSSMGWEDSVGAKRF